MYRVEEGIRIGIHILWDVAGRTIAYGNTLYNYHLLASGRADVVIEPKTNVWDIAARTIIVGEAGGKITDIQGRTVTKDTTSLIATNSVMHDNEVVSTVLDYFKMFTF